MLHSKKQIFCNFIVQTKYYETPDHSIQFFSFIEQL